MAEQDGGKPKSKGNPNWTKGGPSPNPSGKRADGAGAKKRGAAGVFNSDGWTSLLTGLGAVSRDKRESTYFCPDLIDWDTALNIYRGDPLAARIIETKPNELVREGYELCITDDEDEEPDENYAEEDAKKVGILKPGKVQREVLDQRALFGGKMTEGLDKVGKELAEDVENKWEELELLSTLHEAMCYELAYGGAAILIGADDGATDLSQPLNTKAVRGVNFLTALEPRELSPVAWYGDPRAQKFVKPALYQLTPVVPGLTIDKKIHSQNIVIHETRLIVFPGVRVTRRNISQLGGWGDSILTRVYRVLRDFNVSWGAAGILVADFAQAVYKMKGLNELLQEDPKDLFKQRMLGMELSRSVARAVMIDSEDEFERKQTPVAGLSDLLDRFATQLAAAADLPLSLLMGESPGGINASGASGDQLRMFYDKIASTAKRKVVPAIRKITAMIFQSLGGEPETWCVTAPPLWQLTEKEKAEARKIQADVDSIYLDRSVLDPDEVRESRFGGDAYSSETALRQTPGPRMTPEAMGQYIEEQKNAAAQAPPVGPDGEPLPAPEPADPNQSKLGPQPAPSSGTPVPNAGTTAPTAGGREIQKEAMNGAQISSLLEVIQAANDKAISRESAGAVLRLAFQIHQEDADALLGPDTFVPVKPVVAPSPFGGGAPGDKPAPFGKKPDAPIEPPKPEPPAPKADEIERVDMLKEIGGEWYVYSHDGQKKLAGPMSRAAAGERLRQIEAAKAAKDE